MIVYINDFDPAVCEVFPADIPVAVIAFPQGSAIEVDRREDVRAGGQAEFHLESGTYKVAATTARWSLDPTGRKDSSYGYCYCSDFLEDVTVVCGGAVVEVRLQLGCWPISPD